MDEVVGAQCMAPQMTLRVRRPGWCRHEVINSRQWQLGLPIDGTVGERSDVHLAICRDYPDHRSRRSCKETARKKRKKKKGPAGGALDEEMTEEKIVSQRKVMAVNLPRGVVETETSLVIICIVYTSTYRLELYRGLFIL